MCDFFSIPAVHGAIMIVFFFSAAIFLETKAKLAKDKFNRNCKHDQCYKTGENTTYDINLNPTHTTTLKCLNCEKIIEVKK
ncbi:hypothetical protein BRC2024_OQYPJBKP_CDS_0094 [Acinetobacter phage vB_AbaM_Highwayman]|nr:hypothetical protein [Acinetobacter phage Ab59]WMC00571.1 hypothetical protein [Acinetobacter phage Ab65]